MNQYLIEELSKRQRDNYKLIGEILIKVIFF